MTTLLTKDLESQAIARKYFSAALQAGNIAALQAVNTEALQAGDNATLQAGNTSASDTAVLRCTIVELSFCRSNRTVIPEAMCVLFRRGYVCTKQL